MEQRYKNVLIVGIIQDSRYLSYDEIRKIQEKQGFTQYILDVGEPSPFEIELIQAGVKCAIYEGMVNGVYGKTLDRFGLNEGYNRVQAPFLQSQRGDNVVWRYKQELEQQFGVEFPLESELLYDDFILEVLKRSSEESRIFSRELDENGRFVNFDSNKPRTPREEDYDSFREYLEIVKRNCSENKTQRPRANYPQLSLDMLNLVVFMSQLRDGSKEAYFLGGSVSNEYMPRSFNSMSKLFRNKVCPNCQDMFSSNLELILYDVSIGRGNNIYK